MGRPEPESEGDNEDAEELDVDGWVLPVAFEVVDLLELHADKATAAAVSNIPAAMRDDLWDLVLIMYQILSMLITRRLTVMRWPKSGRTA